MQPVAMLIHVEDIKAGLDWYTKAFPLARIKCLPDSDFTVLDINGFQLEVVQADEKVGAGKCGTVLYWQVKNLTQSLQHLMAIGAVLYRGPLDIEDQLSMCQVADPFGNLIGLRGPRLEPSK